MSVRARGTRRVPGHLPRSAYSAQEACLLAVVTSRLDLWFARARALLLCLAVRGRARGARRRRRQPGRRAGSTVMMRPARASQCRHGRSRIQVAKGACPAAPLGPYGTMAESRKGIRWQKMWFPACSGRTGRGRRRQELQLLQLGCCTLTWGLIFDRDLSVGPMPLPGRCGEQR